MTSLVNINIMASSEFLQLSTGALIDAYHNERSLWDVNLNSSEEQKELAWARLATLFNTSAGMYRTNFR